MDQILKQSFLEENEVLRAFMKDEKNFETIGKIATELADA